MLKRTTTLIALTTAMTLGALAPASPTSADVSESPAGMPVADGPCGEVEAKAISTVKAYRALGAKYDDLPYSDRKAMRHLSLSYVNMRALHDQPIPAGLGCKPSLDDKMRSHFKLDREGPILPRF